MEQALSRTAKHINHLSPQNNHYPPYSAWGLWGDHDELGTINLLTPEKVAAAASLIRSGKTFPLNWDLELPDPPLFGREQVKHVIKLKRERVRDDTISFNTQSSSQWDGLTHFGNVRGYYNGVRDEEITGKPGTRNGIQAWARHGITGRGVLLDYHQWALKQGIHYSPGERHEITPESLIAVAKDQNIKFEVGDILLVHSGWISWYKGLDPTQRKKVPENFRAVGLAQGENTLRFLWNNHFSAVAGDSPAFEAYPHHPVHGFMHETIIPLWGMPIGEMFFLEDLVEDCKRDGRYEFFFASAPLNKLGGVASPPNALAIK